MNQSEIADRLQNMFVSTAMLPERRVELAAILRDLRAADEKATRLPEILTRCLNDGNNIALRRIHDTGYSAALVSRGPTGACEYATTPEAAIDALSAVLEKDKA